MRIFLILTALFIVFILSACQPARVLNTVVPSGSYDLERGVSFGEHTRQRMDIYIPYDTPHRDNMIVFVYGGAWDQGTKEQFEFVGQAFARLGYVTVIPNYRLYPDVQFPEFVDDIAKAINYLPEAKSNLADVSCPLTENIILMGHSAGAHTAALLLADSHYFERFIDRDLRVKAFIGLSGPYDLPLEHERVKEKFETVEGNEANPIALAHADMPSTLLLHGESDTIAAPFHTERLTARLTELGVPVTTHYYAGRRHADLLASLASPLRFWSGAYQDIQDFLAANGLDSQCADINSRKPE